MFFLSFLGLLLKVPDISLVLLLSVFRFVHRLSLICLMYFEDMFDFYNLLFLLIHLLLSLDFWLVFVIEFLVFLIVMVFLLVLESLDIVLISFLLVFRLRPIGNLSAIFIFCAVLRLYTAESA